MHAQAARDRTPSRLALWFGLLGGAIAWVLHLLLAYLIAEFGCVGGLGEVRFLGITAVAWLILAVSLLTLAGAVAATVVARRSERPPAHDDDDVGSSEAMFARAGLIISAWFVLIILVETVPILYYLGSC